MKQTLLILALITSTIQTFAQSPRIKLNQITKDTVTGSVLISSPTDSGMVYSRDLFISYGADTFLILGGDTIVLQSDLIAEIGDSLLNYVSRTELSDSTTNIRTDIPLIIADSLLNYVTIDGTQTITGAKTFTSALTQSGGDVNFDSGTLFVGESADNVGIGTSTPTLGKLQVDITNTETALVLNNTNNDYGLMTIRAQGSNKMLIGYNGFAYFGGESGVGSAIQAGGQYGLYMDVSRNIYIGDSIVTPTAKLDVNGNINASGSLSLGTALSVANGGTGSTTFTSGRILFGNGTNAVNTDSDLFWDNTSKRLGIGITSPSQRLTVKQSSNIDQTGGIALERNGNDARLNIYEGGSEWIISPSYSSGGSLYPILFSNTIGGGNTLYLSTTGKVGIGTITPGEKLEVDGKVKIADLTGTGGNAVYENGGVLGVASDSRFKSYLGDIDNAIQKVLDLRPKYFVDNRNSTFQQLGFYAQEVKSVINEASYPIGNTDYLGINDRAIIAVTVKAIQEQQAIIESIQTELNVKSSIIESQATEIEQLKTLITDLSNRLQILENN